LLFLFGSALAAGLGAAGAVSWREHRARSAFFDALRDDPLVRPSLGFDGQHIGAELRDIAMHASIVAPAARPPQWIVMCRPSKLAQRTSMRVVARADPLTSSITQRHGVKIGDEIDGELYVTGSQPDVLRALLMVPSIQLALRVLFSQRYRAMKLEIDSDATLVVEMLRDKHLDANEAKTKLLQVVELARLIDAHYEVAPVVEQSESGSAVGPSSGTPVVVKL
jgi:hypothetical protein